MNRNHSNYSNVKIGQNTENSPGDLKRLDFTQTQVKDHQLTPLRKTHKAYGPFLKWTRDELKQIDQRTGKLMTVHKALHPRDDVDRLYVSRKEGGRGLASIEDSVDASIQRLKEDIQRHDGGLITSITNDTDNTMDNRMTITRKQKWEGK